MKANAFRVSLEYVRGSISGQLDSVEITGPTLRASDGQWWTEATLPQPISATMTLPFSKFVSIVRTLDDDDDIKIEPKGTTCRVKAESAIWELNLLKTPTDPLLEFQPINTIEASGHALLKARKRLKHLILPFLARQGLMRAWTNENKELVIGNGPSLGGYHIGIEGLELPNNVLSEIWRILSVRQSEKMTFHIGEKYIRVTMQDGYFQFALSKGPTFPTDLYNKVRNLLNEDPQEMEMSPSALLRAINQVRATAGQESTLKLAPGTGGLALMTDDECGDKSRSKIEANGTLKEPVSLNIEHLESAVEVLSDELMILKACKSVVQVSDTKGWEVIPRIREVPNPKVKEKNAHDTSEPQDS